jgi:hypothetical protein
MLLAACRLFFSAIIEERQHVGGRISKANGRRKSAFDLQAFSFLL